MFPTRSRFGDFAMYSTAEYFVMLCFFFTLFQPKPLSAARS